MIDFTGICKSYGKQDIFNNVSFRINPGERVGIVGPNGTGKTTLFEILCGEISPDKGEVVIPKKARLGYLRQQLDRFDQNPSVALAAYNAGPNKAAQWLQEYGLDSKGHIAYIPYEETRNYVKRVLQAKENYENLYPEELAKQTED